MENPISIKEKTASRLMDNNTLTGLLMASEEKRFVSIVHQLTPVPLTSGEYRYEIYTNTKYSTTNAMARWRQTPESNPDNAAMAPAPNKSSSHVIKNNCLMPILCISRLRSNLLIATGIKAGNES